MTIQATKKLRFFKVLGVSLLALGCFANPCYSAPPEGWTDDLGADATVTRVRVKSTHLVEIKNEIDRMNTACTIPAPPPILWTTAWTTDVAPGQLIRGEHFNELKTNIRGIYAAKSIAALPSNTVWGDDTVTSQGTIVYKDHVLDMRLALDNLAPICAACGNSVVDTGEGCDDGNTIAGDGCDASCQLEACWPDGYEFFI